MDCVRIHAIVFPPPTGADEQHQMQNYHSMRIGGRTSSQPSIKVVKKTSMRHHATPRNG